MGRKYIYILQLVILGVFFGNVRNINASDAVYSALTSPLQDSTVKDTSITDLKYSFDDEDDFLSGRQKAESPLFLNDPSNIESTVEYDPETNQYILSKKVGEMEYRPSIYMTMEEYKEYEAGHTKREYWKQRSKEKDFETQASFIPSIKFGGEAFDKIFGNNTINITPQGSAELIFGFNVNRQDNPTLPEKLRRTPSFTFDEKIQMNVTGTIGDKFELAINYNTEATFDFENKTKLAYTGDEDEIIKKIEAGNVTLPLPGSLITGSQSLFGLKTELQFGRLTVTSVFSQQRGESSVINVQGGAQVNEFEITVDEYDANRHFFLSHYFRDHYNEALENLPDIRSSVEITKIQVWITNKTNRQEGSRDIVAFMDLSEIGDNLSNEGINDIANYIDYYPGNGINDMYEGLQNIVTNFNAISTSINIGPVELLEGRDYEKVQIARLLTEREFTVNRYLGYISLNTALNADEVLAVAYEVSTPHGKFTVGQFSTENTSGGPLIVKLLKGTNLSPRYKTWDLMMKNVYAIGAYQVEKQDFYLDVLYQNVETGQPINYLTEGVNKEKVLIKLLNLDNLNVQNDQQPDGIFDFINGVTINSRNGRVFFPVLEPFGDDLREAITGGNANLDIIADKYVFDELYDSTKTKAQQIAEKNKFYLSGTYRSSSGSEISLNAMNVPRGSVVVTAGGIKLQEGIDYTVDYTLGRVRIINQGLLESGTPIRIALESNTLFNFQTKTMVGSHFDYRVSDNFNVGATILNLTERPLTQKVNFGDEPISNTIWGFNGSYRTDAQFLTTLVDKIPLIETKEQSTITVEGEFAHLIPGSSRAIGKNGVSYIDDFEGSETSIEMKTIPAWVLASTPQVHFPEAELSNDLAYGYNRAKIAWYVIDPIFLRDNTQTPDHLTNNDKSSHYVREIFEKELFPKKENYNNIPTNIPVLNIAYYPRERGPYNYDTDGVDDNGFLRNPESRWGGIMREVPTPDFETANIEFIEFWLMDPFADDDVDTTGGDLYFNLGDISEDILKDSRKSFENGLPGADSDRPIDTTIWGYIPRGQSYVKGFDENPDSRAQQDVGLDGLSNEQEREHFQDYLNTLPEGSLAYSKAYEDPSSDDYHYYRGKDYDRMKLGILERYKKYNGLEGNSPVSEQSGEAYITSSSNFPDREDINEDNTLSSNDRYYEYKVSIRKEDLVVGENFITNKVNAPVEFENGVKTDIDWYQFKIPLTEYDQIIGAIDDFKSVRFMRMFLTAFNDSVILRFAKLELVRSEWRKYQYSLRETSGGLDIPPETIGTLDISSVNIEENSEKTPVNYVLPVGIDRVIDPTQPQLRQLNEQSMVLKVENLADGDARAAYKNTSLDMRQYKRLKLEVHAEEIVGSLLEDEDLRLFIRLGTDYKNNYYEYEIPLYLTPHLVSPSKYSDEKNSDRIIVWPAENRIDIPLELFTNLKLERDDLSRQAGSNIKPYSPYMKAIDNGRKIAIRGYPSLDEVRTIMIGVRNPSSMNNTNDDGLEKSGEIWVNELRLTDFNDKGGWAANARVTAKLADFGAVSVAGFTSSPGWGSIDQKVNERSLEEVRQIDVSSNLALGKFFPEKAGVRIPMYTGYSKTVIDPQYDPRYPDIEFKEAMRHTPRDERDSIRRIVQDFTERKSINFTNVGIGKTGGQPKIYSVSNWSFTYAYSNTYSRNIDVKDFDQKQYRGAISYNYNLRPKNVTPLRKIKGMKSPYFRIIKDFNFYYFPSRISFRTDVDRRYDEKVLRPRIASLIMPPMVRKDFLWNRYYDFNYDLSRSLKFTFSASTFSRIDEPKYGEDDYRVVKHDEEFYQYWKDSVINAFKHGGRITHYNHMITASYTVPINKIPILNWTTLTTKYTGNYSWDAAPLRRDNIEIGNTIKNSYTLSGNGQLNMVNLYNKAGVLQRINQKYSSRRRPPRESEKEYKEITYQRERVRFRGGAAKTISHNLKTEDVTVRIVNEEGAEVEFEMRILDNNRVRITTNEDVTANVEVIGKVEKKPNPLIFIAENMTRMAMGVRNISFQYSQSEGAILPGYLHKTHMLGFNEDWTAPGWPFILGLEQDTSFVRSAAEDGWLTTSNYSLQNLKYIQTYNETFNIRTTVEPIAGFRIDLNATRSYSENMSENFIFIFEEGRYNFVNMQLTGNYSMSFISFATAFEKDIKKSEAFEKFLENREIISERQAFENYPDYNLRLTDTSNYYNGLSGTSQQVLIPAFMAAYGNMDASKVTLEEFPGYLKMLPNWRVNYEGLSNIEIIQKYFKSVTLSHSYRSTYNVSSYISNDPIYIGQPNEFNGDIIPEYDIQAVSITEQIKPLIGINMNWQNNLTTRIEFGKTRNLSLSMSNALVTEMRTAEYVFGVGYRFEEVPIRIQNQRTGEKEYVSDVNIQGDFTLRDNITMIRSVIEEDINEPQSGQRVYEIRVKADYMLSNSFNLQFFIEKDITKPYTSISYPSQEFRIGFSIRFTLIN